MKAQNEVKHTPKYRITLTRIDDNVLQVWDKNNNYPKNMKVVHREIVQAVTSFEEREAELKALKDSRGVMLEALKGVRGSLDVLRTVVKGEETKWNILIEVMDEAIAKAKEK